MAETASALHCPECGAPVKSGDKQCWMCFRLLAWAGGTVKAAAAAPSAFADHPAQQQRTYYRTNPWAVAGLVLAILAMVPAACIAFFVTCLATFVAAEGQGQAAGAAILPVSAGAAFVVLVGFGILIAMLGKRTTRAVRY
ncbi:MAG: hypothetical protein IAF94_02455 [Pirellulaceae bacterium]|nr:hypothetical protein [Pirellulaceae bacterium]